MSEKVGEKSDRKNLNNDGFGGLTRKAFGPKYKKKDQFVFVSHLRCGGNLTNFVFFKFVIFLFKKKIFYSSKKYYISLLIHYT